MLIKCLHRVLDEKDQQLDFRSQKCFTYVLTYVFITDFTDISALLLLTMYTVGQIKQHYNSATVYYALKHIQQKERRCRNNIYVFAE